MDKEWAIRLHSFRTTDLNQLKGKIWMNIAVMRNKKDFGQIPSNWSQCCCTSCVCVALCDSPPLSPTSSYPPPEKNPSQKTMPDFTVYNTAWNLGKTITLHKTCDKTVPLQYTRFIIALLFDMNGCWSISHCWKCWISSCVSFFLGLAAIS